MSQSEPSGLMMGGQSKIRPEHRNRLAYVYVRQSSFQQVARNRESQVNQYQLARRAEALGWSQERVRTIDSDLGLPGHSSQHRQGFQELVAEVSLGRVGIIFGYEVSKLARNNSDWYTLLDLAAVVGTLIADNDGVYDPRLFNDRLLLGLKGAMSEAELHLLKQRLEAGRLSKVQRGEFQQPLPVGLVRLADGQVIKDPDDQVRHVLELVLAKFAELGSCSQVLRYLRREQIRLPRRSTSRWGQGQVRWQVATYSAVYEIMRNPAYAGAFAYGRKQFDPTRRRLGHQKVGQVTKPMAEWHALHRDIYPAYLSWEQYLANQARLQANGLRFKDVRSGAQGAARAGQALLQGLVRCGACGGRMHVSYKAQPRYQCKVLPDRYDQAGCASLYGPAIDAVVVQAFFEAIQPAHLDGLATVLADQAAEQAQLDRQWAERLKRAEYEARLAQRQYDAVDPDNRLVTAELERRWEEKLREVQTTREAYERFQQRPRLAGLTPALQAQLADISHRLPELWNSGQLRPEHKKELLRSLIDQVILKRLAPDRIEVKIIWVSGHYTLRSAWQPILREQDLPDIERMVARLAELWQQGLTDPAIAAQLTAEGFHSARQSHVSVATVERIRQEQGWTRRHLPSLRAPEPVGYLSVPSLAARLGVKLTRVYGWIRWGHIEPRYVSRHPERGTFLIRDDPDLMAHLRAWVRQHEARRETLRRMRGITG